MTKINLQHRIVKQAFTPDIIRETNAWAGLTKPPDNQPVFVKKKGRLEFKNQLKFGKFREGEKAASQAVLVKSGLCANFVRGHKIFIRCKAVPHRRLAQTQCFISFCRPNIACHQFRSKLTMD
jgi:hypothetical protein